MPHYFPLPVFMVLFKLLPSLIIIISVWSCKDIVQVPFAVKVVGFREKYYWQLKDGRFLPIFPCYDNPSCDGNYEWQRTVDSRYRGSQLPLVWTIFKPVAFQRTFIIMEICAL